MTTEERALLRLLANAILMVTGGSHSRDECNIATQIRSAMKAMDAAREAQEAEDQAFMAAAMEDCDKTLSQIGGGYSPHPADILEKRYGLRPGSFKMAYDRWQADCRVPGLMPSPSGAFKDVSGAFQDREDD